MELGTDMSSIQDIAGFYEGIRKLGKGTFSEVILCTHRITGEKVGECYFRSLSRFSIKLQLTVKKTSKEWAEKSKFSGKSDTQTVCSYTKYTNPISTSTLLWSIQMEGNCMIGLLKTVGNFQWLFRLQEQEAAHYFYQLVLAIEYLASIGISHRDIKPENILLDTNKDIKLIDFGLGKPYNPGELIKTACGSPCYAAPEMVARKHYKGDQVDIWSSGITLFAMLCGKSTINRLSSLRWWRHLNSLRQDLEGRIQHSGSSQCWGSRFDSKNTCHWSKSENIVCRNEESQMAQTSSAL